MIWPRPVCLVNARVVTAAGLAASIRFTSDVLSLDTPPRAGDTVVDLDGAFVLPGLVNAHDHLELNHYGRLRPRDRYTNSSAWIEDLRPLLRSDREIRRNASFPLVQRLFIGVLKNIVSGVTTVAHHNPFYRELRRWPYVRVVNPYGWAHSFALQRGPVGARGEPGGDVRQRYLATPGDVPFFVHLAEGADEAAAAELARFASLGCLRRNAVLVHGVALAPDEWSQIASTGASLVWCPASNQFLFGCTVPVGRFRDRIGSLRSIALGTDSRLTGSRDLLDELKAAAAAQPVTAAELLEMVTVNAAHVVRAPGAGRISVGSPADLIVLPPVRATAAATLLTVTRADIRLVSIGGRPIVASPELRTIFSARRVPRSRLVVDDVEKAVDARLARAIEGCPIEERGVVGPSVPRTAACV